MELSKLTKKRIQEYLKTGKRFDSRGLLDFRKIEIETGVIKNAEGSARVKFGDSDLIVGVKLDISEPFPDSEEEGVLITNAEFLPLASPRFELGPPQIDAIELARIVDRGLRESGFIDFEKLCIKKGEKVWSIFVDIYPLNADGNLIDIAALGAIVALKTARFPKYDEKNEKVIYGEHTEKKLPLSNKIPLTITFYKIGKNIIIDPVEEEEESSEGRISIAVSKDKEYLIHAIQKGGGCAFTEEEIGAIIDNAIKKHSVLFSRIEKLEKNLKAK
ncbi:MAG: exosome complex protein Rrp42 [Candidatus Pacearchaeota archaeon]